MPSPKLPFGVGGRRSWVGSGVTVTCPAAGRLPGRSRRSRAGHSDAHYEANNRGLDAVIAGVGLMNESSLLLQVFGDDSTGEVWTLVHPPSVRRSSIRVTGLCVSSDSSPTRVPLRIECLRHPLKRFLFGAARTQ